MSLDVHTFKRKSENQVSKHRGRNNYQYYFGGLLYFKYSVAGPKTLFYLIKQEILTHTGAYLWSTKTPVLYTLEATLQEMWFCIHQGVSLQMLRRQT